MKTIIYSLLVVFILGIVAQGFMYRPDSTRKILIQSTDDRISSSELTLSADIISKRLKSFNNEEFKITTIPGKHQILVTLSGSVDVKTITNLIIQKGSLEFFETYNTRELQELLKGGNRLFSFFQGKTPDAESAELGCNPTNDVAIVNDYLSGQGLQEKCKFAWTNFFEHKEACLYSLKLSNTGGVLLRGSDIEYFQVKHEKDSKFGALEFKFKQPSIAVWADITTRDINRSIAIVMDGNVLCAPVVREKITGGKCQITGDFTESQLKFLAAVAENGELPVDFRVVQ